MSETFDAVQPSLSLPTNDELPIEQRIVNGLDAAALLFLAVLQDVRKDEEGNLLIDAKTRMEAFKMCSDWLAKRTKANASGSGDGMPAYEKVRKWLDEQGYEIVPKKRGKGRPSLEQIRRDQEILGPAKALEAAIEPEPAPVPDGELAQRLALLAEKRGSAVNA